MSRLTATPEFEKAMLEEGETLEKILVKLREAGKLVDTMKWDNAVDGGFSWLVNGLIELEDHLIEFLEENK